MNITPQNTIERLNRLSLNRHQFSAIHHFGPEASLKSHIRYLSGCWEYRVDCNNYVVAERLAEIELLNIQGVSLDNAIEKAVAMYPLR